MTDTHDSPVATQPKRRTAKVRAAVPDIMRLYLGGHGYDSIATQTSVARGTVIDVIQEQLQLSRAERSDEIATLLEEAIQRDELAMREALTRLHQSVTADKPAGDPRWLDQYQKAAAHAAKLRGLEAVKVEHSGSVEIAGAKSALAAAFEALAETTAPEDDADAEGEGET